MARTHMTGFEVGGWLGDSLSTAALPAGITYDTTTVRTGARSLKVVAPSGAATASVSMGTSGILWHRVYVLFDAFPTGVARHVVGGATLDGLSVGFSVINSAGTNRFRLHYPTGTADSDPITTGVWYRLEWRVSNNAGHTGVIGMVDGTALQSGATATVANTSTHFGARDNVASTYTCYFDDYVADNADFPGDGKVALLLPASQNSVTASTWQKPGGATTNMHTSVDNVPPVGVANSTNVAQAENQIRNAVSNATANVLFNMQMYAVAGVGDQLQEDTTVASVNIANDSSNVITAHSMELAGSLTSVQLALGKTGSPTDNVVVDLRADNAGNPGAVVANIGSISAVGLTTSPVWTTFTPNTPLAVSGKYWLSITRSGTIDSIDCARVWLGPVGSHSGTSVPRASDLSGAGSYGGDMAFRAFVGTPTVNAVQAFAIVGLATTATTKQGSLEVISNPAVAEVNFGAYGTGAAVGTFPTGWQRRSHTIAQNPSVTLNTAPVVELGQRTANTTIAQCCFVGMYVDYTPAAAPPAGDVGPAYVGAGYYG